MKKINIVSLKNITFSGVEQICMIDTNDEAIPDLTLVAFNLHRY